MISVTKINEESCERRRKKPRILYSLTINKSLKRSLKTNVVNQRRNGRNGMEEAQGFMWIHSQPLKIVTPCSSFLA